MPWVWSDTDKGPDHHCQCCRVCCQSAVGDHLSYLERKRHHNIHKHTHSAYIQHRLPRGTYLYLLQGRLSKDFLYQVKLVRSDLWDQSWGIGIPLLLLNCFLDRCCWLPIPEASAKRLWLISSFSLIPWEIRLTFGSIRCLWMVFADKLAGTASTCNATNCCPLHWITCPPCCNSNGEIYECVSPIWKGWFTVSCREEILVNRPKIY